MILAAALTENHIKSPIDIHFGRCNYYCIFNSENGSNLFIENPVHSDEESTGCFSAEMLLNYHITAAVAGRFGNRVVDCFWQNNVQMIIAQKDQTLEYIINRLNKP